jgi:CheY-like chemotaxis protein
MMNPILVIDDDIEILNTLCRILEREGYDVLAASDGNEGLKFCRQQRVDLVITDLVMPEKEGIETIMELRCDFPHVPIIAMSGGGRIAPENYLHMAQMLGAQRTLRKPFTPKEMLEAIGEVLK